MKKPSIVVRPKAAKRKRPNAALREPKTDEEVAHAVAKAKALFMQRAVKECLRQKLPSTIVLMAASEVVGLIGSMMGVPYAQVLQAGCNGIEASYRATAPPDRQPQALMAQDALQ